MSKVPRLIIPKEIWDKLIEIAKNNVSDTRVFTLFQERYKRYNIKDVGERKIKKDENGIERYDDKKNYTKFYPEKKSNVRNCGSVWILPRKESLILSLTDAYWMGRDLVEIRILMKSNYKGEVSYKSYWTKEGAFFPIKVENT